MEVIHPAQRIEVRDASAVALARRTVNAVAAEADLSEEEGGRAALVATELATNLVKHAGGGELIIADFRNGDLHGVDLLALDNGPGMADPARCLMDGYSTAGSPGTGLGAIQRQSQVFDLYTEPGKGVVMFARVLAESRRSVGSSSFDVCGFAVPVAPEIVSGDCWSMRERGGGLVIIGADGLGHGVGAAEASQAACLLLRDDAGDPPTELLEKAHRALRPTRGAAVAVAEIDWHAGKVIYAAIGNLSGTLVGRGTARKLVSYSGTIGHAVRSFRSLDYPWIADGALILHSDGLATSWQAERYPGLIDRASGVIAGLLYRDFRRGRDDCLIVVAKRAQP